jgi:trk system potassium uptake protein TrkH
VNLKVLYRLLGVINLVVGGALVLPLLFALYGGEHIVSMLASIAIALGTGGFLMFLGGAPETEGFFRREGLAVVGIGWLLVGLLGAFPFYFTGVTPKFVDAYFESVSALTTTGSSILSGEQIEAAPRCILFWRSLLQWLGGMGIVVLFVAIIPFLRASGKQLLYTEVPGPTSENLHPKIQDTAAALWKIYLSFTVVLCVLLAVQGMDWFDAICHAFTTMSTGGFSTKGDSIGGFGSLGIEITIIVFMLLAGTNFSLYYRAVGGQWGAIFKDPEWRFYLFVLALSTGLIALELGLRTGDFGAATRTAGFQVVSIVTTTGFGTDDFDTWPSFSRALMVVLMFVGGCSGSTSGGLKIVRILVIIKNAIIATEHSFRPQTVRALKVGSSVVEQETRETILAYFTVIIGTMVIGTLALCALQMDIVSALTAVASTLNNIGPGLGTVGAVESFALVPDSGKVMLSLFMVVGRLEVFAILVLFSPTLWRSH